MEDTMKSTPDFSLEVEGVNGVCPAGERWAQQQIEEARIPVFSCEGPCIRGEIARLAANLVATEQPYARCCHAETFFVPHSGMARWAKGAEKVVMIDGCFLKCHGRALKNLVGEEKMVHFDAFFLYKKSTEYFSWMMCRRSNARKWRGRLLRRSWRRLGKQRMSRQKRTFSNCCCDVNACACNIEQFFGEHGCVL